MEKMDTGVVNPGRWRHIRKLLERPGPFCHPDFEPSPNNLGFLMDQCRVLVVGAGGLGCELLKNLVLLGFYNIHVIDMDTIDISNLNRQLLFRMGDVGQYKAEVAAKFLNQRIQGAKVVPHCCKIQEKPKSFYKSFHVVVCGLDSIEARRWLNSMILSLVEYDDDGKLKHESLIPIIDGGTEGFKGSVRVIVPKYSPCIECTLDLYPPAVTYPVCTIANTPRLPEHCIEYARIILWDKEKPFESAIDGDDPTHITWIYEKANERATQYGITGVTYRLTQGVIKNIIPAVASTNAVIAAACSTEVFKIATMCYSYLNNYMVFSDIEGIYTYSYEGERKDNCSACSGNTGKVLTLEFPLNVTLQGVINFLVESREYQMKSPGIVANINGRTETLFTVEADRTNENLRKRLTELGLKSGDEIIVTDPTTPTTLTFKIVLKEDLNNA